MQKFKIKKAWKGYKGEMILFEGFIELDEEVIKAVDDEWRSVFYSGLKTPQEIAEHIAFNFIVNNAKLSDLDGFANLGNDMANIYT